MGFFNKPVVFLVAVAIALVLAIVGWRGISEHIAQDATAHLLLAKDDSLVVYYRARADSIHATVVHDTVQTTKWYAKYETIHDTVLKHLTDTLTVKEYVQITDSTIKACRLVVQDCQQETAQLRLELAASEDKAKQAIRLMPTFLQRHEGAVAGVAVLVGVYLGSLIHR